MKDAPESTSTTDGAGESRENKKPKTGVIRTLADIRKSNGFWGKYFQLKRESWLDWVTLCAIGIVTGGLWTLHSTRVRYFPVTFSDSGDVVYPDLAYPLEDAIFSSTAAGVMAAVIPIAAILLCQIHPRIRSFANAYFGILGLAYSLVTGTFFQVVLKKSIGGFRPHFLTVCQPDISKPGSGFQSIMYRSDSCTGDPKKIQNAMESFPSGHSQIAFAGFLYLSIYLNAHLRVFSFSAGPATKRPHHWQMLCVIAPVLLATYLASTLVLGHHHHWYDVLFGSLIGSIMSIWSYKMMFVSVWDRRTNTQPLRRPRKGQVNEDHSGLPNGNGHAVLPTTRPDTGHENV